MYYNNIKIKTTNVYCLVFEMRVQVGVFLPLTKNQFTDFINDIMAVQLNATYRSILSNMDL